MLNASVPCLNVLNGGYVDNTVDFLEFMIAPHNVLFALPKPSAWESNGFHSVKAACIVVVTVLR